jgi:hypothetical protein
VKNAMDLEPGGDLQLFEGGQLQQIPRPFGSSE